MKQKKTQKWLALLLAVVMMIGVLPMHAFATTTDSVTNYADFMTNLKVLETYAVEYAQGTGTDAGELVLNFIRTGVERYQDSNWTTLAGQENTGFTSFVEAQDAEHGTNAMSLKNIVISTEDESGNKAYFTLPNGNPVDFGHMFGCMNISYVASGSADLSGWAGDICDLLQYSVSQLEKIDGYAEGDVEKMAAYIQEHCFGVNASGAYGWDDFYGDMDAYYLIAEYKKSGGTKKFSELMEAYFTSTLNDTDRTVYFMNNRFAVADSQEAVRKAIYESYSADVGLKVLEASRGLSSYNALRQACCYAFADYVYSQAKGKLIEGTVSNGPANGYYSVFSTEHSILAPGITQDINYAQTADGKQIVYYVATVDVNRDDVTIMANYKDNDPSKGWGYQRVEDQAMALLDNYQGRYENFNVIVATNADAYNMSTGEPGGLLIMDGREWHAVDGDGFFAILKDGSAVIGTKEDYEKYKDQIQEAVGGFGAVLVKDGKINVTKNANYTASRASRTAIGITAEGKVVMMVLDGRQLPFSAGGAMEEIAQIMLEAGCVHAINLDGGGSTTYLSKPAGSDTLQLVNRPSDGYARGVATSLVAVSTAKPSTEFDRAVISSDYEYITAGTSMQFSVTGVSNTGNAAVIPQGAYWQTSNSAIGTIDETTGLFTAVATGEVTVQYVVNGEVAGEKVIHVVIPDDIKFVEDRITAIYGVPKKLDLTLWYQGYPVAFTPLKDAVVLFVEPTDEVGFVSKAGVIDGMTFTGNDANKVRMVNILAVVVADDTEIIRMGTISLYYKDEATFDFENATQGSRRLAWYREVENAKSIDNMLYRISDPESPITVKYTFALDMTTIDIPAQLEPLKSMLPGSDVEGATAWSFLLQLAERVCVQTYVKITSQFSPDLDVDISELKVVNDYFTLTSATVDENNVLTVICHWKNQSAPIPAATANPLCILAGIKATVKEDANYINSEISIVNNGHVSYDIYLAASSLYSFAQDAENQAKYGLYPYIHEEDCRSDFAEEEEGEENTGGNNNDKGAHFSSQYAEFADIYVINSEVRKGWVENSYYVENMPVTGVQFIPSREDKYKKFFYEFDQKGVLVKPLSGLIEYEGDLYYAMNGEPQKRWASFTDEAGQAKYYYFDPVTYKAVDGAVQIDEGIIFTYTFENHILVKGDLRPYNCTYDKCTIAAHKSGGLGYRWAGNWVQGQWVEIDGNSYYFQKYHTVADTGFLYKSPTNQDVPYEGYYLFDENGVFQKDFTGIYNDYYLRNGMAYGYQTRLVEIDGYYYLVLNDLKIFKGGSYWVSTAMTGGLVDVPSNGASFAFDAYGRMTNDLVTPGLENKTIENKTSDNTVTATVLGRVMTVQSSKACWVLCLVDGKYQLVEAWVNPYATVSAAEDPVSEYNFIIPQGATAVQIVLAGDINLDGQVNGEDVHWKSGSLTDMQKALADINGNGVVNVVDKILLALAMREKTLTW